MPKVTFLMNRKTLRSRLVQEFISPTNFLVKATKMTVTNQQLGQYLKLLQHNYILQKLSHHMSTAPMTWHAFLKSSTDNNEPNGTNMSHASSGSDTRIRFQQTTKKVLSHNHNTPDRWIRWPANALLPGRMIRRRYLVTNSLVRTQFIIIGTITINNVLQSIQTKDHQMIQAFFFTAEHITFRIGIWILCQMHPMGTIRCNVARSLIVFIPYTAKWLRLSRLNKTGVKTESFITRMMDC